MSTNDISQAEEAELRRCNAWDNIKCSACFEQATHDDQGFPLRGQPFFVAFCKKHVRSGRENPSEPASGTAPRDVIYADITAERVRQDTKWGGKEHDKHHTVNDWVRLIHEHADKARAAANVGDIKEARARLVEVAALSVASLEMLDVIASYSSWEKS